MGQCAPQSFPNFSTECIEALRARVRTEGVNAESSPGGNTSGTASRAGFHIAWKYDPISETLTVQCTSSPFYAPCSLITAQIKNWITACYPASQVASNRS